MFFAFETPIRGCVAPSTRLRVTSLFRIRTRAQVTYKIQPEDLTRSGTERARVVLARTASRITDAENDNEFSFMDCLVCTTTNCVDRGKCNLHAYMCWQQAQSASPKNRSLKRVCCEKLLCSMCDEERAAHGSGAESGPRCALSPTKANPRPKLQTQ